MNHTIGKMHQFLATQLPIYTEQSNGVPAGYVKNCDVVVFLSKNNLYVKVLTADGLIGKVPYFPERDHWVEYEG